MTSPGVCKITVRKRGKYQCPCTIADKPCSDNCSCVNPFSSFACKCCAGYGNDEQRKANANFIVAVLSGACVAAQEMADIWAQANEKYPYDNDEPFDLPDAEER